MPMDKRGTKVSVGSTKTLNAFHTNRTKRGCTDWSNCDFNPTKIKAFNYKNLVLFKYHHGSHLNLSHNDQCIAQVMWSHRFLLSHLVPVFQRLPCKTQDVTPGILNLTSAFPSGTADKLGSLLSWLASCIMCICPGTHGATCWNQCWTPGCSLWPAPQSGTWTHIEHPLLCLLIKIDCFRIVITLISKCNQNCIFDVHEKYESR